MAVIVMVVPPARSIPSCGERCPVPIMVPPSTMIKAASTVRGVHGLILRFRDRGAFDPAKGFVRLFVSCRVPAGASVTPHAARRLGPVSRSVAAVRPYRFSLRKPSVL
ncbi:hypothetical protein GCM10009838_09400 [Catenulispora subtropica]|uniref:Secreted protein n=1 Tax=Catenulispora subtropica TaxID=450798 RepID=A0ABN2QNT9_9ACTN